ncbi:conserved hypothetical protein [Candidatus Methylobacter favarea]|uniref:DUF748 domain-containing protein n=1 Tax=Candidatus Methylobacter favarea TaxID=2707345 RepID=A0A8S0Y6D9_9GAMM|nr:DUF748 domain-containing protein [Candidatus Methylobacter favarea]CAA9891123.1 conserved hypothetical protein [Candidatus Methylobacter favarea]
MKARRILPKALKVFFIISSLLVMYAVMGFYILPAVLKWKMPEIIQQETGRKTSISKIQFNPFSLFASLQGFAMQEQNGRPFVRFDTFYIKIKPVQSITQSALVIEKVLLEKPFVHIARQKNGEFNFNDLLTNKREAKKKEDKQLFPLRVIKLSISEGKFLWEDDYFDKPEKEEVYPINLDIENFTTHADIQSRLGLSFMLGSGGNFEWQGDVGINPMTSSGHIKLNNVKLQRISQLAVQNTIQFDLQGSELLEADYKFRYADKALELIINQGKLDIRDFQFAQKKPGKVLIRAPALVFEANYKVGYADNNLDLTVDKGHSDVRNFQLSEQGQDKVLAKIPEFSLRGLDFNLDGQELAIESVSAKDADFQAWLNAEGIINYQGLFPASNTEENSSNKTGANTVKPEKTPWNIRINNIALTNFGAVFEDQTLKKPVSMTARPIDFKLTNFSSKTGAKLPFQLSMGVNKTGSIKLDGDTVIEPFSSQLALDVKNIDLEKFQPYANKFARLDIIDGKFDMDGKATVTRQENNKLDVKFKGNADIASLITRDQMLNKDFVKWKNLTFKAINADLLANSYTAETLIINKPYARVVISKDKSVNVKDIVIARKSKPAVSGKPEKNEPVNQRKPYFKIAKVKMIDGSSDFADLSLILPFAAQISSLDGGASGVSSEKKATIIIGLKGNAYELAPVDIKGEISPYRGDYDVELNFQGLPMPLISPYMVQFAGYKVEKGKLTLGLKYKVVNNQLTAANSILIDQLTLGEKIENPDAVSLPLELAIALLKDSSGKIKLDVPITGSLEDPKFSIGAIIFKALTNAIGKVISSPFRAIASLIGTQEDLSTIDFAAGKSELDERQREKLDGLAKALRERPVLKLDIKGAAFREQDWPALREAALYDQLKGIKAAELNKKSDIKILEEYVELSDEDYKRLLADLFIEKFPAMAERSFFGKPQLVNPDAGDFYEIARQKLSAIIKPEPHRLKDLASERAQAIAKYIVQQGRIQNERVYILDTVIDPETDNKEISAFLSLRVS